jgi:hypothetical protein
METSEVNSGYGVPVGGGLLGAWGASRRLF